MGPPGRADLTCLNHRSTTLIALLRSFAGAILIVTIACAAATAANAVGSLIEDSGSIKIIRHGRILIASTGSAVELNDIISCGPASHATVLLSDGSKLQLDAQTTLAIDQHVVGDNGRYSTRLRLLFGQLRALVSHSTSGAGPNFTVETANGIAGVRGTSFSVDYGHDGASGSQAKCTRFAVDVFDGAVAVRGLSKDSHLVSGGFGTTVICGGRPARPVNLATKENLSGTGSAQEIDPAAAEPPAPPPPAPPPPSVLGIPIQLPPAPIHPPSLPPIVPVHVR